MCDYHPLDCVEFQFQFSSSRRDSEEPKKNYFKPKSANEESKREIIDQSLFHLINQKITKKSLLST